MKRPGTLLSFASKMLPFLVVAIAGCWIGYRLGGNRAVSTTVAAERPLSASETVESITKARSEREATVAAGVEVDSRRSRDAIVRPENPGVDELVERLAHVLPPGEALDYIARDNVPDGEKSQILRALVLEWITSDNRLSPEEVEAWQRRIGSITGDRFGLEVELGMALAEARLDPGIAQAWMDAYRNHPGRSRLFASLLQDQFRTDPLAVLQESSGWTAWEQRRFEQNLFQDWARNEPEAALEWYARNRDLVGEQTSSDILNTVSESHPALASGLLPSVQNPDQRKRLIQTIATNLAQKGTGSAVEWAGSLPDEAERNAALEAVYHATPRGIGAVLSRENGYPMIRELVPGGPLESSGLVPGDLIVQTREAGGEPIDLHGMPMGELVQTLRGEPGSEVEVRILRRNPESGQFEELETRVTRDVLIIPAQEG